MDTLIPTVTDSDSDSIFWTSEAAAPVTSCLDVVGGGMMAIERAFLWVQLQRKYKRKTATQKTFTLFLLSFSGFGVFFGVLFFVP